MDKYQEYIQSYEWRKRAERIKERDGWRCTVCLSTEELEVHHKTYERLFNEDDDDLITLCSFHHKAITNANRERKYGEIEFEPQNITNPSSNQRGVKNVREVNVQDCGNIPVNSTQRADKRPPQPILQNAQRGNGQEK